MIFFKRMFAPEVFKGQRNYINTQKKYEIIKTILLFAISFALFLAGYLTTHTRMNLLTLVAVLGCLPACKSAVNMIMFLRYKSLDEGTALKLQERAGNLPELFDLVFTSYDKNYQVDHLVYKDKNIVGFSGADINEENLRKHLTEKLLVGGHKGLTIKIFNNEDKYLDRLEQLKGLDGKEDDCEAVFATLKAISL